MSKDKSKFGTERTVYGGIALPKKPEAVKKTNQAGQSGGWKDEIEEQLKRIRDESVKQNRDSLDAMYNIDEENMSSTMRRMFLSWTDGIKNANLAIEAAVGENGVVWSTMAELEKEVKDALTGYVTETELDASIGAYIDGEAGTAKIVSAVSGTYATKESLGDYATTNAVNEALGSYVKSAELDASIGAYIDGEAGQASIVQAVSGTYATKSDISGFVTETEVSSSITQSVNSAMAKLALSVSNGTSSATITLKTDGSGKSGTIDLSGLVKFSSLSTPGATTIDGANIKTGKISADRIDVGELNTRKVIFDDSTYNFTVFSSGMAAPSQAAVKVGLESELTSGMAQFLQLYGSQVLLNKPSFNSYSDCAIIFDLVNNMMVPSLSGKFDLGAASNCFNRVYADSYLFEDGSEIFIGTEGLMFYNANNQRTYTIDMTRY